MDVKGKQIQFPVIDTKAETAQKQQKKTAKFFKKYQQKKREEQRENKANEKIATKYSIKNAPIIRAQRAAFLADEFVNGRSVLTDDSLTTEKLKFGLTSFGLVNCDYFSRQIPEEFVMLDSLQTENDSLYVQASDEVRIVVFDDNTYLSTPRVHIPIFKQSVKVIGFFMVGLAEMVVLHFNNKTISAKRINIEGKSSNEIRTKILSN